MRVEGAAYSDTYVPACMFIRDPADSRRVLVAPGGRFNVTRPRLPGQEVPGGPAGNRLAVLAGSCQITPVRKVSS